MSDEMIPVPKVALEWLFGEAPGPHGKWFGEDMDALEHAPPAWRMRTCWWRSKFRSMIPALSVTNGDVLRAEAKAALDRIDARKGEDIDEWARKLGNDLGKFTD